MEFTVAYDSFKMLSRVLNRIFANCEPWQVSAITASILLTTIWFWKVLFQDECLWSRARKQFFRQMRKLPLVRNNIQKKLNQATNDFENEMIKSCENLSYVLKLPENGLSNDEIRAIVDDHLSIGRYDWNNGRVSGAVYGYNKDLVQLITEVYGKASYTNPLHSDIFPGICKMEAEVVRIACTLFHGNENSCGTVTTGGTESIILACKAYRDYARTSKNISSPNMVVPRTAHAAFDKAGQFFNIHLQYINVDSETLEVDVESIKRAINKNTILLVGSAPNFPYGTIDNIEDIARLGIKYNIPVHVDACLGSFLVAFMSEAGYSVKPFDFTVKGVTSISADTHKYGFAPKGSSLILYSEKKYRNHQYTVTTDWPGGVYGSPTVNGSRAGGIIAACWATMMSYGLNGYLEAAKRILDTARYIERGLRKVDAIYVFGNPATSVIAIGSKVLDIYRLSDVLCKAGWNLNALQFPSAVHICITDMHTGPGIADKFLADLHDAVRAIMKNPTQQVEGRMAVYGIAQSIPDRSIVSEITRCYINSLYYTPVDKPESCTQ